MIRDERTAGVDALPTPPLDALLARTRCPRCHGTLRLDAAVRDVERGTKTGSLFCTGCQRIAASIDRWRFDFNDPSPAPTNRATSLVGPLLERRLGADDAGASWSDGRQMIDGRWGMLGTGAQVQVQSVCTDALVRLARHPWGGVAEILVDGVAVGEIDLYQASGTMVVGFPILTDAEPAARTVSVRAMNRDEHAPRTQVFVESFVLHAPAGVPGFGPITEINLGNPRSASIEAYTDDRASDAWVLECGGGDRRRSDPRWVNLEYLPFELASGYGDIHAMPFADGTFDIVSSQAVFEHIRQPFVAAGELMRVCKPGGLILTEAAFFQPVHGVPDHYFNMTLSGLRELFAGATIEQEGWSANLASTLEWMLDTTGLLEDRAVTSRQLVDLARELDRHLPNDRAEAIAGAVFLAVRIPDT